MRITLGSLSPQAFSRFQGIELIQKGYDNEDIADIVEVAVRTFRRWRNKLKNNEEENTLHRKKGSGRIARLKDKQKQQIKQIILQGAIKAGCCVRFILATRRRE